MKKIVILFIIGSFLSSLTFADVKKHTKSKVQFEGFGTFTTEEIAKIKASIKRMDSKSKFKGKGIAGRLVGKFVKQGDSGEIINLVEMMQYSLNHKKKQYTVRAIEEISLPVVMTGDKSKPGDMQQEREKYKSEDQPKIIRSVFRIDETGEKKDINKFPCEKFVLLLLTEWENTRTGQRGIDSLSTTLWMTEFTDELKQANEEEMAFSRAHLKALGMDVDQMYEDILGTNWLSLLGKMKQEKKESKSLNPKLADEMKKLRGYPVIIDGKYFAIRPKPETEMTDKDEDETDVTDVKKSMGRFAKGLFSNKKKEPKGPKPLFSYRTELVEYKLTKFKDGELSVDSKYKKK